VQFPGIAGQLGGNLLCAFDCFLKSTQLPKRNRKQPQVLDRILIRPDSYFELPDGSFDQALVYGKPKSQGPHLQCTGPSAF
jgi:hypothetical protein